MEQINEELSTLELKHRKEKKELQAQIQVLKKAIKGDKTKKKELLAEIVKLENDLEKRQRDEIHKVTTEPVNNSESQPECDANETNKNKISKAQRRRNKKNEIEKEREQEIKLQEKENLLGPRNIEIKDINARLQERKLCLFLIPSDGDCLYKAVSHQMEVVRDQCISVQELRKKVADHIRANENDFKLFMTNPKTDDLLTDIEFDQYCEKIENTKVWGGQLEIKAISAILKCPIHIIQSTGPPICQGDNFNGLPLIITYHRHMYSLGEHYNSTICLAENNDS